MKELTDQELAREALRSILTDRTAPAAAKASAARTLAELAGALGRHAKPVDDDLPDAFAMTRSEINAELSGLSPGRSPGAHQVTPGEAVTPAVSVTPGKPDATGQG